MRINCSLALALFAMSLFAGCAQVGKQSQAMNGHYIIREISGVTFPNTPAKVNISGVDILGQGPVNQWSAEIVDGRVSALVSTRRAGPVQLMNLEQKILTNLEGSRLSQSRNGTVTFKKEGENVLVLEQIESFRR